MATNIKHAAFPTAPAAAARAPVPRVAFVVNDLKPGGVQRVVTIIAGAFARRGVAVDLLACDAAGRLRDHLPPGVRFVPLERGSAAVGRLLALRADPAGLGAMLRPVLLARRPLRPLRNLQALARYFREVRPTAVFSGTPPVNVLTLLARRLARVETRVVVSERTHFTAMQGDPDEAGEWRRLHLPPLMRRLYSEADAIVAVSAGVADDLARVTAIPRGRIAILHNPTITPDFEARAAEPIDDPWFTRPGPPVVLGVGRLGRQKDFETLLRAFGILRLSRPARLAIIGETTDPKKQTARHEGFFRLAAELGVRDDLRLMGYRANPLPYMAKAAVFALSSRYEGLPNVLLEALACGRPVVSTDCPSGPREILEDGRHGRLVPVGDPAAMAAALEAALDDPPDPEAQKARAADYGYEAAIARYAALVLGRDALDEGATDEAVPALV